jgi:hypothetical protein
MLTESTSARVAAKCLSATDEVVRPFRWKVVDLPIGMDNEQLKTRRIAVGICLKPPSWALM